MDKQTTYKSNIYTHDDGSKVFILAMLLPFIVSFFASYIAGAIATGKGVEIEVITSSFWFVLVVSLVNVAMYVGIWMCYSKLKEISPMAVSFKPKMKWHTYLVVILLGVVMLMGLQYLVQAFENLLGLTGYPIDDSFGSIDPQNVGEYFFAIFALALVPAFCEELIFRGIVFNGLRERFSTRWALIISALAFTIVHGNLQQLIYPFILGCLLGLIMARTGSLFASMVVHFVNNFIVVTMRFVENITGFSMQLDGWILYLVAGIGLVAAFAVWLLVDKCYFKKKNKEEVEITSQKTSSYLYIAFAIGAALYVLNVATYVISSGLAA